MRPDEELQFQRWKDHVYKNAGTEEEQIFRYLWNLYSSLLAEISEINRQNRTYKFLYNGKNDEGKTPNK
jgi:hypothetical protein